tara:strand:+ start:2715 stop:3326 length:612 start_codon:yes stop_codon:yes gene_type:complete
MAAYNGLDNCVIFDFETLSTDVNQGVVLSIGLLSYSDTRFSSEIPYSYDELLENSKYMKFDVEDQVKSYNRKVSKSTLEWWNKQGEDAKSVLKPNSALDESISQLYNFFVLNVNMNNLKTVFCRGNTFDIPFMEGIMKQTGNSVPYPFWMVRDTRSYLDGLLFGSGKRNSYIPDGCDERFIAHDARHDVVMDVMRMQTIIQAL